MRVSAPCLVATPVNQSGIEAHLTGLSFDTELCLIITVPECSGTSLPSARRRFSGSPG